MWIRSFYGVWILAVAFLLTGTATPVAAQGGTGGITGTIRDAQGGVLPGVTVALRNQASGVVRTTVTELDGTFRFAALNPGRFTVTAELPSFATVEVRDIEMTIGLELTQDVTMQVQTVAETILVTGNAPTVDAVEAFTFSSFDGMEIEAFLTKPVSIPTGQKAPLITMIHGGPHGQQGPGFNQKAQIYAPNGFATLMVNYRGSTGYGQKLTDAIFQDQNGGEAKDVIAGVDAALSRYDWIDRTHLGVEGGSYGGQLTNWLITQTTRFRAAIPSAGISNLVSFNYMAYYHDYLAVEFGGFPHEEFKPVDRKLWPAPPKTIMDVLWERSPIRYVAQVKTPTLFLHGENDNDVPIAEAEQFFIALKEVGVETTMVRYPREGHGIREVKHIEDVITRSVEWYKKYFAVSNTNRHQ